ncbi:nuclear transport factor 2 family protein [Trujillonella endophytica]|uniref:SnoaL-like domain-containing protein n=1 Tax=Trujillonella endophytica TaxID=673521 RepID=A0A1H8V5L3_9ACTN|nr:nuclear transport factor 2 family protein [Trujillella endophytica]SEP10651.1 SnoaL-like domain-containing protein [Trujillella endophytica]
MLDDKLAAELSEHWEQGWNREDLDTIMAPYADDVVFSSPFVVRATGDPKRTTIVGAAALREYVDGALRRTPGIRYTLDGSFTGTDSLVLVYTVHLPNGVDKTGADLMRVDDAGRIVEWRSHYAAFTPAETDHLGPG